MIDPVRLAAYVASRICHDAISPASSVKNALDMLDEPGDEEMRPIYEKHLRESAHKTAASIQYFRYAFGSAGLYTGAADLHMFKNISEEYLAGLKPSVEWDIQTEHLSWSHARLLMNMLMMGVDCLPRGGVVNVRVRDEAAGMTITLTCTGQRAKLKDEMAAIVKGETPEDNFGPENIQPKFAIMVCNELNGEMSASQGDEKVILMAAGVRATG
ncbi:MAG: histidine phosphotransferase family protein [Hyphomonas sp.]